MTQIPEIGSVWVSKNSKFHRVRILFADDVTVYSERLDERAARHNRNQAGTQEFVEAFKPEPHMITHRVWVNLYGDGSISYALSSKEEALDRAKLIGPYGDQIVETRCIEWEVEE